ncbi:MAG: Lrp/AsnC family transcriptional regulator [Methanosarcinales archaeon]
MDDIDFAILKYLSVNSRAHSTDIAKELGVATSTIHKRINTLLEDKVIESFTITIDPLKIGLNVTIYLGINIDPDKRINIINKLKKMDDVLEIHEILEPYDLFVKVRTFDINTLKNVLQKINRMDGVIGTNSILTTKKHKETPCNIFKR